MDTILLEIYNYSQHIVLFGTLLAVICIIPICVAIVSFVYKKRFKTIKTLILVSASHVILIIAASMISKMIFLKLIFGSFIFPLKTIYEYQSERSFNGDGYSIEVYEMPQEYKNKFNNSKAKIESIYPLKPSVRDEWDVIKWKKGPIREADQQYVKFGLSGEVALYEDQILASALESVRNAVNGEGVYYSLFKKEISGHLFNVDLFIIDFENNRVIIANMNM